MNELRHQALHCLLLTDPVKKVEQTQALYQDWKEGVLTLSSSSIDVPE
jgi:hypothetical protein